MDIVDDLEIDLVSHAIKGILCGSPKILSDRESFQRSLSRIKILDKRLRNLLLLSVDEQIPEIICSAPVIGDQLRSSLIETLYNACGCEEQFSNRVIDIWVRTYEFIRESNKRTINGTLPINALRFEDDTYKNEIVALQNCVQDIRLSEIDMPRELLDPLSSHGYTTVEDILVSNKRSLNSAGLSNTAICILVECLLKLDVPEGTAPFYQVFAASLASEVDNSVKQMYQKVFDNSEPVYFSVYKRALKKLSLFPNLSVKRLVQDDVFANTLIANNLNNVRDLVQMSAIDFFFVNDVDAALKTRVIECLDNNRIPSSLYKHLQKAVGDDIYAALCSLSDTPITNYAFSVREISCLQIHNVSNLYGLWLLYRKNHRRKADDPNELYLCPGRTLHLTINKLLDSLPEDLQATMDKATQWISNIHIESLELSLRTRNCLKRANKNVLGDILGITLSELNEIRNLGRDGRNEIVIFLENLGVTTTM